LLSDGLWQMAIGSKKTKHIRFLEGVLDLDVRALTANREGTIYSLASAGGPLMPEPLPAPLIYIYIYTYVYIYIWFGILWECWELCYVPLLAQDG
jgi:hypothetical protein